MVWGTLVHAALEALVRALINIKAVDEGKGAAGLASLTGLTERAALESLAEAVIRAESQPVELKDELAELLEKFAASALWQRIVNADDVLTETSFGVWDKSIYSTGVVDLAIRENGSWILVDYKSDTIEDKKHLQALVKSYTPQVQLYKRCWEEITGEKVAECGLFFTDKLQYSTEK